MEERRPVLSGAEVLTALAHPVRLDVLNFLMSDGPATASACARAVGDNPSNCSYHLRVLARHGLVQAQESTDGRERPWRATITGFSIDDQDAAVDEAGAGAVQAAALQLDQRLAREYLARQADVPARWRAAASNATYTLRMNPDELRALVQQLDGLIRPFVAATREDAPTDAELVHIGVQAFPRLRSS